MDFPANEAVRDALIGRRIVDVEQSSIYDEGWIIHLDDGTVLHFGFSGCEGVITISSRSS